MVHSKQLVKLRNSRYIKTGYHGILGDALRNVDKHAKKLHKSMSQMHGENNNLTLNRLYLYENINHFLT